MTAPAQPFAPAPDHRPPQPDAGESRDHHRHAQPADDLAADTRHHQAAVQDMENAQHAFVRRRMNEHFRGRRVEIDHRPHRAAARWALALLRRRDQDRPAVPGRAEAHTAELLSLMRNTRAVFGSNKKMSEDRVHRPYWDEHEAM